MSQPPTLTQVLERALANGASLFAVPNPEADPGTRRDDPDYWDVAPTTRPRSIVEWLPEVDDLVRVEIYDGEMRIMGTLMVLVQGDEDWLVDCDTGEFTDTITAWT